jgi:hypothetical protein
MNLGLLDAGGAIATSRSLGNAGCWMLDAGCWMLDAGCWMLDAGCWMLVRQFFKKIL